jgi:hypothetical protein
MCPSHRARSHCRGAKTSAVAWRHYVAPDWERFYRAFLFSLPLVGDRKLFMRPMSRRGLAGGRGDSVWTTTEHTVAWCELPPAFKDQLPCLVRVTRLTPGMPTVRCLADAPSASRTSVEGAVRGLPGIRRTGSGVRCSCDAPLWRAGQTAAAVSFVGCHHLPLVDWVGR